MERKIIVILTALISTVAFADRGTTDSRLNDHCIQETVGAPGTRDHSAVAADDEAKKAAELSAEMLRKTEAAQIKILDQVEAQLNREFSDSSALIRRLVNISRSQFGLPGFTRRMDGPELVNMVGPPSSGKSSPIFRWAILTGVIHRLQYVELEPGQIEAPLEQLEAASDQQNEHLGPGPNILFIDEAHRYKRNLNEKREKTVLVDATDAEGAPTQVEKKIIINERELRNRTQKPFQSALGNGETLADVIPAVDLVRILDGITGDYREAQNLRDLFASKKDEKSVADGKTLGEAYVESTSRALKMERRAREAAAAWLIRAQKERPDLLLSKEELKIEGIESFKNLISMSSYDFTNAWVKNPEAMVQYFYRVAHGLPKQVRRTFHNMVLVMAQNDPEADNEIRVGLSQSGKKADRETLRQAWLDYPKQKLAERVAQRWAGGDASIASRLQLSELIVRAPLSPAGFRQSVQNRFIESGDTFKASLKKMGFDASLTYDDSVLNYLERQTDTPGNDPRNFKPLLRRLIEDVRDRMYRRIVVRPELQNGDALAIRVAVTDRNGKRMLDVTVSPESRIGEKTELAEHSGTWTTDSEQTQWIKANFLAEMTFAGLLMHRSLPASPLTLFNDKLGQWDHWTMPNLPSLPAKVKEDQVRLFLAGLMGERRFDVETSWGASASEMAEELLAEVIEQSAKLGDKPYLETLRSAQWKTAVEKAVKKNDWKGIPDFLASMLKEIKANSEKYREQIDALARELMTKKTMTPADVETFLRQYRGPGFLARWLPSLFRDTETQISAELLTRPQGAVYVGEAWEMFRLMNMNMQSRHQD